MKFLYALVLILLCFGLNANAKGNPWSSEKAHTYLFKSSLHSNIKSGQLLILDEAAFWDGVSAPKPTVILPVSSVEYETFFVESSDLLPEKLKTKYPELATYRAYSTTRPNVTATIERTTDGVHAMIVTPDSVYFIDPEFGSGNLYCLHNRADEMRKNGASFSCGIVQNTETNQLPSTLHTSKNAQKTANGWYKKLYRIAIACDSQYATAVTFKLHPTKAEVLSKMIVTMNRVSGIYERELSVSFQFVDNNDTLIYLSSNSWYAQNDEFAGNILDINQTVIDSVIGSSNYDLGHAFTTGAGGLSSVGVVCDSTFKAHSVTGLSQPFGDGYDVDYVSHEIGHEFGANHTFNNNYQGACNGNAVTLDALEPGSGSTIMAYAGICTGDNIQSHSDAYFHSASLIEISDYINDPLRGGKCPVKTLTGNKLVYRDPLPKTNFSIPAFTPFELTATTAVDSVADTLITYCWEQWNRGDFGSSFKNTHQYGPLFRSYMPTKSTSRTFPAVQFITPDPASPIDSDGKKGEKLPDCDRFLTFKNTVRNVMNGMGCFLIDDDTVHIDVVKTTSPFVITYPVNSEVWKAGANHTISWKTGNTTAAPISCDSVDISMSLDEGKSWAYNLGRFTNSGNADVYIPNVLTDSFVRFKVKAFNNIFLTINPKNIIVEHVDSQIIYFPSWLISGPNPTSDYLKITFPFDDVIHIVIDDVTGRQAYKGDMNREINIPTKGWPTGIYFVRLYNSASSQYDVRRLLVY